MFLSFIVPVYNTEKYLNECLNSLIMQNIPSKEYEIICINDGSQMEVFKFYDSLRKTTQT
ncbi:MAG: glycosyltransferase [Clostridia bacterium]|nr:glycosyltransferase [Clostridia bacterium]